MSFLALTASASLAPATSTCRPAICATSWPHARFVAHDTSTRRSRYKTTIWTHLFASAVWIWELTLEVTSFKAEDQLRSITFVCRLSGEPVIITSLLSREQLILLLAGIAHAMERSSAERTPLAEGIFCGAPLEPAA
jgi:hypothetical protein